MLLVIEAVEKIAVVLFAAGEIVVEHEIVKVQIVEVSVSVTDAGTAAVGIQTGFVIDAAAGKSSVVAAFPAFAFVQLNRYLMLQLAPMSLT